MLLRAATSRLINRVRLREISVTVNRRKFHSHAVICQTVNSNTPTPDVVISPSPAAGAGTTTGVSAATDQPNIGDLPPHPKLVDAVTKAEHPKQKPLRFLQILPSYPYLHIGSDGRVFDNNTQEWASTSDRLQIHFQYLPGKFKPVEVSRAQFVWSAFHNGDHLPSTSQIEFLDGDSNNCSISNMWERPDMRSGAPGENYIYNGNDAKPTNPGQLVPMGTDRFMTNIFGHAPSGDVVKFQLRVSRMGNIVDTNWKTQGSTNPNTCDAAFRWLIQQIYDFGPSTTIGDLANQFQPDQVVNALQLRKDQYYIACMIADALPSFAQQFYHPPDPNKKPDATYTGDLKALRSQYDDVIKRQPEPAGPSTRIDIFTPVKQFGFK